LGILGTMVVNFTANVTGLTAGTNTAKAKLAEISAGGALVAGGLLLVGGAAAAAGVQTVKMAGDFQKGLTALQTGAGESSKNLGMVSDGIKQIAIDTGTSTSDLLSAMFMVNSAGNYGADGLKVLTIAAQGAKTDNADLTTTTMALTGVMTNFKIPASGAAGAMNELVAASKDGKMHLQDLSAALGPIGMVATNAGLKFADVSAAVAMMTNRNVSAQQASQNLAFAVRSLDAPSGVAVKSLASVGLKAQDVADTLRNQGLPAALQLIEEHVGTKFPASSVEWTTAMKNIMGGKAGLNVALALGGDNLKTYEKDVGDVTNALKAGGTSVEGWSTVQKTLNNTMDRAREVVEVTAINIGSALMPAVMQIVAAFGNLITVGTNVVTFFQQNQSAMEVLKVVAMALAGVIGGLLVAALVTCTTSALVFLASFLTFAAPFVLVGVAIGLLIAGIVLLVQHWNQATRALGPVGDAMNALRATITGVMVGISSVTEKETLKAKVSAINNTIEQKNKLIE